MNRKTTFLRWLLMIFAGLLFVGNSAFAQELVISPDPVNLGDRPIGAWMETSPVTLENISASSLVISNVETDNPDYFGLDLPAFPFTLAAGETAEIGVFMQGTPAVGNIAGQLVIQFADAARDVSVAALSVDAYTPDEGDVYEDPFMVVLPVNEVGVLTTGFFNNYNLTGPATDGKDAVYMFSLATDQLVSVTLTAADAKMAVYAADFAPNDGPRAGNEIYAAEDAATNLELFAGDYYLVVSTTAGAYDLDITTSDMPAPDAATYVAPIDTDVDVINGDDLEWTFGANTLEYQVILGTTYPPATVVVDWTSDLATTYELNNLQPNLQYFWQVNTRNNNHTTVNPVVWGFTTTLTPPKNFMAENDSIYEGDDLVLNWENPLGARAFLGYNVYQGVTMLNTTMITETTYTVEGLTYEMGGYDFTATAIYDEGESEPSDVATVKVTGEGTLMGHVEDLHTGANIGGATVTMVGVDEFGEDQTYTTTTYPTGNYTADVFAGTYDISVAAEGYITAEETGVAVAYGTTVTTDFLLYETAYPVAVVNASEFGENILIEWSFDANSQGGDRALVEFQVWREKAYVSSPMDMIGTTSQYQFVDFDWSEQDWGVYKWYVVAVYDLNESDPVASEEAIDKDMNTVVDVTVALNSGESPAGTLVEFTNVDESPELVYSTLLPEDGIFTWNEFRRGTYDILVSHPGFGVINETGVDIFDTTSFEWLLEETLAIPTELYVTPTGLAMWEGGSGAAPAPRSRASLGYKVFIGENGGTGTSLVAETESREYQFDPETLEDGTVYDVEVAAVFTTGQSVKANFTFLYVACENYDTPDAFTATQVAGTANVELAWTNVDALALDTIDAIRLYRDGLEFQQIDFTTEVVSSYIDEDMNFGTYNYCVTYIYDSKAESCPAAVCADVDVTGGAFVEGTVTQAPYLGGDPIEGAAVILTSTGFTATFITDADGMYSGEVLGNETYDYTVEAFGYVTQTLTAIEILQTQTEVRDFVMMEFPTPVELVVAEEISDNQVKVSWRSPGTPLFEPFMDDFSNGLDNWTVSASNWAINQSANAGGTAPELRFNWLPSTTDEISIVSSAIPYAYANSELYLSFKHMLDNFTSGYTLSVFTVADGVEYVVHEWFPSADIPATTFEATLTAEHGLGAEEFQIGFRFNGATVKIDNWYIDDVVLNNTRSRNAFSREIPESTLAGYNVYRTTCADGGDLQFQGYVLDTIFYDNTWGTAESGTYKWAVEAVYAENESEARFSNCLDKDMVTTVSVTVNTDSGDSPEGTDVLFTNTSEPDLELTYETQLDETGYFAWEEFRKGTYDIHAEKLGFGPIQISDYLIDSPENFVWLLEELLLPVSDLYVTPTGFATWRAGGVIPFEPFIDDFSGGIDNWTKVPNTNNWQLSQTDLAGGDSPEVRFYWSPNTTDRFYFISPMMSTLTQTEIEMSFDHFINDFGGGYTIQLVTIADGVEYEVIDFPAADAPATNVVTTLTTAHGVGAAEFQIAFVYEGAAWDINWWNIDNIMLYTPGSREFQNYKVWLDGVFVTDTEETFHQYAIENLVPGQSYLAEVAAMYTTGMSAKMEYTWTYVPCGNYAGPQVYTAEVIDENDVLLTWSDVEPMSLIKITQNPGAPANAYYQSYGTVYGVAYDLSAYPDALVNSLDFHHASWGLTGTWQFNVHVYNWDTKTLIETVGPITTTGNDIWEMGVELGDINVAGVNTVALLLEPLSNAADDAYPDFSSDDAANPQGSIYGPLNDVNSIGSSTIGNFLQEMYIYTAYGPVKATPVNFDLVQAPVAQAKAAVNPATEAPVISQNAVASRATDLFVGVNVYRDEMMIAEMVQDTFYLDESVDGGEYTYCIRYVYESGAMTCEGAYCEDVLIMEACDAPQNLVVENLSTELGPQEIQLTWNENVSEVFRYDDDVSTGQLGFQEGTTDGLLGAKHSVSAELTEMSWYTTSEGGPHTSVKIYVLGLSTSGMPNANDVLYSATVTNTDNTWNTHTFPTPVNAEGGFYIALGYNGFAGLGTDDGIGEPYVFQNNTHYYSGDYTGNSWTTFESSGFPVNAMIRATGVAGAKASYAVASETTADMAVEFDKTRNPVVYIINDPVATGSPQWSTTPSRSMDRGLVGFNIYKDGVLIEALWPDNTYTYEESIASYTCYTVTAEYEYCGESEPSNEACIDIITGINALSLNNTRVYPNPATNNVVIESAQMNRITVMNALGQLVLDRAIEGETRHELNTSAYEAGIYLIRIETNEGVVSKRLTIVR